MSQHTTHYLRILIKHIANGDLDWHFLNPQVAASGNYKTVLHEGERYPFLDFRRTSLKHKRLHGRSLGMLDFSDSSFEDLQIESFWLMHDFFDNCKIIGIQANDLRVEHGSAANTTIERCVFVDSQIQSDMDDTKLFGCKFDRSSLRLGMGSTIKFMCCELYSLSLSLSSRFHSIGDLANQGADLLFEQCIIYKLSIFLESGHRKVPVLRFERVSLTHVTASQTREMSSRGKPLTLHLVDCRMRNCDFSFATLMDSYFIRCDLRDVNFEGSDLSDTHFEDCIFDNCNFAPNWNPKR